MIWEDARRLERVKVRHLETQLEEFTQKLDDKNLQVRTLEDDLQKCQVLLRTCEGRLKEALIEVERLYRNNKNQVTSLGIPEDDVTLIPTELISCSPTHTVESLSSVSPQTPGGQKQ